MNIRDMHNMIPLHSALSSGAKSCVGLLLYAGANYNLQVSLFTSLSIVVPALVLVLVLPLLVSMLP